jgi:hypothetical protein
VQILGRSDDERLQHPESQLRADARPEYLGSYSVLRKAISTNSVFKRQFSAEFVAFDRTRPEVEYAK